MEDLGRGLLPKRDDNSRGIRQKSLIILASILLTFPCLLYVLKLQSSSSSSVKTSDGFNAVLPVLLRDLLDEGLINKGQKGLLLCSQNEEGIKFLTTTGINLVRQEDSQTEKPLDFVFSSSTIQGLQLQSLNKILKNKGIVTFPLSNDLKFLSHYKIVYLRRFEGKTVIAMKKTRTQRQQPIIKKTILKNLESVYLEPPPLKNKKKSIVTKSHKIKFLPDLINDSLDEYPRRVFISDETKALDWFKRNYPMKRQDFEFHHGGAWWLENNARREDYVVMKAEAQVVEELMRNQRINLVDELFLECGNKWRNRNGDKNGRRRRKAYWECLDLYGQVRDEGIAVHQWWN